MLVALLEQYYIDSSHRMQALATIVTQLQSNNVVFEEHVFEIITQYLHLWGIKEDKILQFVVAQKNTLETHTLTLQDYVSVQLLTLGLQCQRFEFDQILHFIVALKYIIRILNLKTIETALEQQLMMCLRTPEHRIYAYNVIDTLQNNPPAQTRVLAALFDDDQSINFEKDKTQLIQWSSKLQAGVPGACIQRDKLMSFLSDMEDSYNWITEYATTAQTNLIICSDACGTSLKQKLVQDTLQNSTLQENSCDYLLRQKNITQKQLQQVLQYASKLNFSVGSSALQNVVCSAVDCDNITECINLNSFLINGLIFTAYEVNNSEKSLLIVESVLQNQPSSNFVFDFRGLTGYMLALKQLNYDSNYIFQKVHPFLQQDDDLLFVNDQSIVSISSDDIQSVFEIILRSEQTLYKQLFLFVLNSQLKQESKVMVLLPNIHFCLQQFSSDPEENTNIVNKTLDYAVEIKFPSYQIFSVVLEILQFQPNWKFNNKCVFHFTEQLLVENKFQELTEIFSSHFLNFNKTIELNQWKELFSIVMSKFQNETDNLDDEIVNFLLLFFDFKIKDVNDYLVQFCIMLINTSQENTAVIEQLLNQTFDGQISNTEQLIHLLDKFSDIQPCHKLPESLLQFLDENINSLTSQMSNRTLSYCVETTQKESTLVCLHCYLLLHSKFKHEITPQIWKSALLNAALQKQYEQGFEILQHVPSERRKQEKHWELNEPDFQSSEIILEIKGGQNFEKGWELIKNMWNTSGTIPQYEIVVLLQFLIEKQNPHNCGIIAEKIMDSLQPHFSNNQLELSTLFVLTDAVTCSDQSINKEEAVIHILQSFLNIQNKLNVDVLQFNNFVSQCQLCNAKVLPVVVVIVLSCGVEIGNDVLDTLDYDENSQIVLNEWFQCKSVLDLVFDKSMVELQNLAQKQSINMHLKQYLKHQLKGQKEDGQIDDLNGYEDVEWKGFKKSQWLSTLVEEGNWKQWSQDKLLACAQSLKGSKLKQYKQKRELIQIIEKIYNKILT
eukprot:TRINITY_DN3307_c0_g2_i3.p1 TRINITY_DN3307_c0_g2~~TRINITY_DN3307_c0_g2_i3.p1  ORF type:complete len:1007 (-),score=100.09 TRINITY_DN3307_c0_g2_i3:252-3272(-)